MRLLRRYVTWPLVGLSLFAIVAIVFCLVMGRWQWEVYTEQQSDAAEARQNAQIVPLADVLGPDDPLSNANANRRVEVTGQWRDDKSLWVTGRAPQLGVAGDGFWLLTPLAVAGGPSNGGAPAWLYVARGWSASAGSFPPADDGDATVVVSLQATEPSSGLSTGDEVASIRLPALANEAPRGTDIYGAWGLQQGGLDRAATGLTPIAPMDPDVSWTVGLKNLAYAAQWWVFAAFALFMWWRMTREAMAVTPHEPPDDTE